MGEGGETGGAEAVFGVEGRVDVLLEGGECADGLEALAAVWDGC